MASNLQFLPSCVPSNQATSEVPSTSEAIGLSDASRRLVWDFSAPKPPPPLANVQTNPNSLDAINESSRQSHLNPIREEANDIPDPKRVKISDSRTGDLETDAILIPRGNVLGSSSPLLLSTSPIAHAPSLTGHVLNSPGLLEDTQPTLNSASDTSTQSPPSIPPDEIDDLDSETPDVDSSSTGSSSVFEEDFTSDYTASLLSEAENFTYENGRRYHSYREGTYVIPNDEPEQDRQDLLHHVRNLVLRGRLFHAPLDKNIQRVLDIGTGTGIWAIDFADIFPTAQVIGIDLSPIQPAWVPPNCRFIVDDAEADWLYSRSQPFDYIHSRDMGGSISDWPRLLAQSFQHLRPGGWIELCEFEVMLKSDDDSMLLAPTLREFLDHLDQASARFNRPMNIARHHRRQLIEAGFEDVHDDTFKVPSSTWPTDPLNKEIGKYNLCSLLLAVESYSLALFTRVLGWSNERTQVFLAGVRRELKNPNVRSYCTLHVVYGRKPSHQ